VATLHSPHPLSCPRSSLEPFQTFYALQSLPNPPVGSLCDLISHFACENRSLSMPRGQFPNSSLFSPFREVRAFFPKAISTWACTHPLFPAGTLPLTPALPQSLPSCSSLPTAYKLVQVFPFLKNFQPSLPPPKVLPSPLLPCYHASLIGSALSPCLESPPPNSMGPPVLSKEASVFLCRCSQRPRGLDSQTRELSLVLAHLAFSGQWTFGFSTFFLSSPFPPLNPFLNIYCTLGVPMWLSGKEHV